MLFRYLNKLLMFFNYIIVRPLYDFDENLIVIIYALRAV